MKLIIKQKLVSWFASFNVYDENDNVVFAVSGKPAWGHKFVIHDSVGNELGCVKEKIISFLPTYEVYKQDVKVGAIKREFSMFKPKYSFDLGDYAVEGNVFGLSYQIKKNNEVVAQINKKLMAFTDTYNIEVSEEDALNVTMIVLAIDADNCRRKN